MNHDMYLLPFYFILINASEQLRVLNDLFLIIDKEINMLCTVMHHIHFNFFRQLPELHIISGALYFDYMFGIQKNIGPHGMIPGIFTDFSPCKWIKRFQISIKQMLNIIFIPDFQFRQLFFPDSAALVRRPFQKTFQKKIIVLIIVILFILENIDISERLPIANKTETTDLR